MTNGNGAPPEAAPPPQLNVLAQYTKDLSFENPNAPSSLAPQQQQPAINIQINVSANNIAENEYEVTLSVEGKAENAGKLMFSFDLAYAGVFRIVNVPKENLHPLVMIECPRLLFPFAREIIATSVRDGGFPPLMLDPVDFVGLYRQNLERQAAAQAAQSPYPANSSKSVLRRAGVKTFVDYRPEAGQEHCSESHYVQINGARGHARLVAQQHPLGDLQNAACCKR